MTPRAVGSGTAWTPRPSRAYIVRCRESPRRAGPFRRSPWRCIVLSSGKVVGCDRRGSRGAYPRSPSRASGPPPEGHHTTLKVFPMSWALSAQLYMTTGTYVTSPEANQVEGPVADRRAAAPRSPKRPEGAPKYTDAVMCRCASFR